MAKINWTDESLYSLESIRDFIEKDSSFYARLTVENIIQKVENLIEFPKIGRIVPEYKRDDIREIFYKDYRIIYRINGDTSNILTVVHSSRNLDSE